MDNVSARVKLMGNLQAAVSEAVAGTMDERGRGTACRGMGANIRACENSRYQRGGIMGVNALIVVISQHSNKYGDKLIDFMERYGITGLIDATEEQLTEYIKEKFSEVPE